MKHKYRFLFFVLSILISFNTYPQKTFNTKGSGQVKLENNMSREKAQKEAKAQAIVKAIENVLGTYVEQETKIDIEDGYTKFKIIANTKVRGEWLKTDKETYSENSIVSKNPNGKGNITELWITCNIKGIVREIIKPKLAFEAVTLNCPQIVCRTTRFYNNEQFYLNFKVPSSGYLSVYIIELETVYRLLPYAEMDDNYIDAVQVKADKDYIFFSQSPDHDYFIDFPSHRIDELEMTTELDIEYVQIYVVFSTEPFTKPILREGVLLQSGSLPKSLSKSQFEKWITTNRIYNTAFNYEIVNLEITKK